MSNDAGWNHLIQECIPNKLMVEEVLKGDTPFEHTEHWKATEIVESALKYTTLTFRKIFKSSNKRGVLQRLKDVIPNVKPVIVGKPKLNQRLSSGIYH